MNRLAREGMRPVPTSGASRGEIYREASATPKRRAPSTAAAAHGRRSSPPERPRAPTDFASGGASPATGALGRRRASVPRSQLGERGRRPSGVGRAVWSRASVGNGWTEHVERRGSGVHQSGGGFQVCGLHTVVEGRGPALYACTHAPREAAAQAALQAASYNLEVQVKCAKSTDPGPVPVHAAYVLFAFRAPTDTLWVLANAVSRTWRIERRRGGAVTCLASAVDPTLRPNAFVSVLLQVRGAEVSVDANGVPIFTSVRVPAVPDGEGGTAAAPWPADAPVLSGGVGVGALRGKAVVKDFRVGPVLPHAADRSSSHRGSARGAEGRSGGGGGGSSAAPLGAGGAGGTGGASNTGGADGRSAFARRKQRNPFTGDDAALVAMVERDVVEAELGVTFDDIASLDDAKRLMNEAVVLPLLVPEFFTGIREPWRGVLLFGPPGTGKTMLARAVAGMNEATFFNVSAASLTSKWRGESERLVRCLFAMARHYAPSIVFLDEIDAVMQARGGGSEHEASRRLKAEILTQMDGLTSRGGAGQHVMVLATTNTPWDLDEALRRRLEKRIYVPLPDEAARADMLRLNTRGIALGADVDLGALARRTKGYSGADIHVLCREASMAPMRRLLANRSPGDIAALRRAGQLQQAPEVGMADFEAALRATQPSVRPEDLRRFDVWMQTHGAR